MLTADILRFTARSILAHRLRSFLTMLGIVIGIASVVLLTSIGEGTRVYILSEFAQFGSNLLQVSPGNMKTSGPAGAFGGTTNPLTIDDAVALERVPGVEKVVPILFGTAQVSTGERRRSVYIYGTTDALPDVMKFGVRQGRFLPEGDPRHGAAVCVLGPTLKREIFGARNALGEHVKIGGERYTVIGIMASKGLMMGFDIDDAAYIPVARAIPLFNRDDLVEIDVLFSNVDATSVVKKRIREVMLSRHRNTEDFTIITQTEMLDTLGRILGIINYAIGGIAGISLVVGAIGILTMMWISVNERTREIGLSKALGASSAQILVLFLGEAACLSTLGGALGLALALGFSSALKLAVPNLPLSTPAEFILMALGVSFAVGVLSGVLPARRAAALDPIEALAAE